jgi:uncharacterized DUF497 family protein
MRIEFDPRKSARNIEQRGLSFERSVEFDWTTAIVASSNRNGETRFAAVGYLGDRLHVLVFTKPGDALRIISLRRANKREVNRYEKAQPRVD